MAFTNSSLVTVKVPAYKGNYTPGRQNNLIREITIHHMAGVCTAKQCGAVFQAVGRNGSAHYGVGNDGSIGLYVEEKDIAWANSNWAANCRAVTIETSNSIYGDAYGWPVSGAAMKSLIKLVADIAKRNNLGKLEVGKNLTYHQMYAATACPGPYLIGKMKYIAEQANLINYPEKPVAHNSKIDANNTYRAINYLVKYTYDKNIRTKTGTNKYGYEIAVNSKGIITAIQDGIGNIAIPVGGYVFSGHGTAATYLKGLNLKVGNSMWQENGYIKYSKNIYHNMNGTNTQRKTNDLIVYNKANSSTQTNKYGYEVAVIKGVAQSAPIYGSGNMKIPAGGWVLSGHGDSGKWMSANIKKGSKISYDSARQLITIQQ